MVSRRKVLQVLTAAPILGGAVMAVMILLRYFKPTALGGIRGLVAPPDQAGSSVQPVALLSELQEPWDFMDFIYIRNSVEYSSRKIQGAKIPGFVVKLPEAFADPAQPKSGFLVVQRICPHLGCTFNFVKDAEELAGSYNYTPPKPTHPYFACPCHLSVYDPTRRQSAGLSGMLPGKVVSGPAPRPPRYMDFEIKDNQIVITGTEGGGVG